VARELQDFLLAVIDPDRVCSSDGIASAGTVPHPQITRRDPMRRFLCGVVTLVVLAGSSWGDEEKVPLDKLPKAVVEAVKEKFPKAELISAEKETEKDKTTYAVTIKNGDQELEVTVTPEGKIQVISREIEIGDLPKAVKAAIKARYPKATIQSAEEIIEEDKITQYEVVLAIGKKQLEVIFDPKGKLIEEEEKDSKH
jgi:hypothetical protein